MLMANNNELKIPNSPLIGRKNMRKSFNQSRSKKKKHRKINNPKINVSPLEDASKIDN